jgi:2-methylcitrate dehydratase PrpD
VLPASRSLTDASADEYQADSMGAERAKPALLVAISERLSDLRGEGLPGDVAERALVCVADALACALLGVDEKAARAARAVLGSSASGPAEPPAAVAGVWGTDRFASPQEAAFANAVASHALLLEDVDLQSATHPGTIVVPAALAVAEARGVSGRDFLNGVVAGYETIGCIGAAVQRVSAFSAREFRQSGVFGPFGAAAAAGIALKLPSDRLAGALALAGNLSGGLREWAHAGTPDVYFHNGFAAQNGLLAARLAEEGIGGPLGLLEGRAGFNHAYADGEADFEAAVDRLGEEFALRRVFFKPAPACQAVQTVLQVARRLREERGFDPRQIESVTVFTSRHGAYKPGNDFPGPFSTLRQAQMSNQFAVAAGLLHDKVGFEHYRRFDDPLISQLAVKVSVVADSDIESRFPVQRGARVSVRLGDGRSVEAAQDDLLEPSAADVFEKLEDAAAVALPAGRAAELRAAVEALPESGSVGRLTALLRAGPPQAVGDGNTEGTQKAVDDGPDERRDACL